MSGARRASDGHTESGDRSTHLRGASLPDLLATYVGVLAELRRRGVTRTDKVVGEYAEALVARALGLDRAAGPTEGYDAIHPVTAQRYQVKARRLGPKWKEAGMGPFRNLDRPLFDVFVGVVFDPDLLVIRAISLPRALVTELARVVRYDGTHRLQVGRRLAEADGVTDITRLLQETAAAWTSEVTPG
jgi:hypothetical protein